MHDTDFACGHDLIRIAEVSHDPGWADMMLQNRNTTTDSWTWVDMELPSAHDTVVIAAEKAYTNRQANAEFAYCEQDFDESNQLVTMWEPGMHIVTRLLSLFPGWCMYASSGHIMTFHAF